MSNAIPGPWAGARASVETAAPYGSLAGHAPSSLGLAPSALPVWTEARFLADSVIFSEHLNTPNY